MPKSTGDIAINVSMVMNRRAFGTSCNLANCKRGNFNTIMKPKQTHGMHKWSYTLRPLGCPLLLHGAPTSPPRTKRAKTSIGLRK